jgi:hypothetical protein
MLGAFKDGFAGTAATASAKQIATVQTALNVLIELIGSH